MHPSFLRQSAAWRMSSDWQCWIHGPTGTCPTLAALSEMEWKHQGQLHHPELQPPATNMTAAGHILFFTLLPIQTSDQLLLIFKTMYQKSNQNVAVKAIFSYVHCTTVHVHQHQLLCQWYYSSSMQLTHIIQASSTIIVVYILKTFHG